MVNSKLQSNLVYLLKESGMINCPAVLSGRKVYCGRPCWHTRRLVTAWLDPGVLLEPYASLEVTLISVDLAAID